MCIMHFCRVRSEDRKQHRIFSLRSPYPKNRWKTKAGIEPVITGVIELMVLIARHVGCILDRVKTSELRVDDQCSKFVSDRFSGLRERTCGQTEDKYEGPIMRFLLHICKYVKRIKALKIVISLSRRYKSRALSRCKVLIFKKFCSREVTSI